MSLLALVLLGVCGPAQSRKHVFSNRLSIVGLMPSDSFYCQTLSMGVSSSATWHWPDSTSCLSTGVGDRQQLYRVTLTKFSAYRGRHQPSRPCSFMRLAAMSSCLVVELECGISKSAVQGGLAQSQAWGKGGVGRALRASYFCRHCFSKWTAARPSCFHNGAFMRWFSLFSSLVPWITHGLAKALPVLGVFMWLRQKTLAVHRESFRRSVEIPESIVEISRPWLLIFFPCLQRALSKILWKNDLDSERSFEALNPKDEICILVLLRKKIILAWIWTFGSIKIIPKQVGNCRVQGRVVV